MWTAGYKYSWRKMEAAAQAELDGDKRSVAWPMFHRVRQDMSKMQNALKCTKSYIILKYPKCPDYKHGSYNEQSQ